MVGRSASKKSKRFEVNPMNPKHQGYSRSHETGYMEFQGRGGRDKRATD